MIALVEERRAQSGIAPLCAALGLSGDLLSAARESAARPGAPATPAAAGLDGDGA